MLSGPTEPALVPAPPPSGSRRLSAAWALPAVALAYFALGRLSFHASVSHHIVTLVVFAAEGVSLAAALRVGSRAGAGVFVGQLALALSSGLPLWPALAVSAVNGGECALAAWAARRAQLDPDLGRGPFASAWIELDVFLLGSNFTTLAVAALFAERRLAEARLEQTNAVLSRALAEVKTLRGLVPICAWCKDIRAPDGAWHKLEEVLSRQTEAELTHGMCPTCFARHEAERAVRKRGS